MPDEPNPLMDPTEVLKHIRTFIEAWSERAYGTPFEGIFRDIRNILDKALPPKPRRRPTKQ